MIVLSQAKHLYVVLQDNLTVKQPISKLKAKQCYSTNSWWFIAAEYAKSLYILPYLQPGIHDFTYGVNFALSGAAALFETHREAIS